MAENAGTVLGGRYVLAGVLGRGGHSVVYRAHDRITGGDVAVKMLHDSVAGDPEHTVRLVREHRASKLLSGTAAVHVLDTTHSPEGALCLVMELLTGRDLDDELADLERRGLRPQVPWLLSLLEPIVTTLDVAHGAGVVHRDLKPGNVFLAVNGVRLLDFGLAKVPSARPLTRRGMIIGSPSYIAPEIWSGDVDRQDQRVDLYALGVIVFRVLSGRVPFDAPSLRDKIELVKSAPRPRLSALRGDLPAEVDTWTEQALAIDPASRFFRARALLGALRLALGH